MATYIFFNLRDVIGTCLNIQWGARAPPGREKNFFGTICRGNLYVHPQAEQEVNFLRNFCWVTGGKGWSVLVVNLAALFTEDDD